MIFLFYDFIEREREWERKRQTEREREKLNKPIINLTSMIVWPRKSSDSLVSFCRSLEWSSNKNGSKLFFFSFKFWSRSLRAHRKRPIPTCDKIRNPDSRTKNTNKIHRRFASKKNATLLSETRFIFLMCLELIGGKNGDSTKYTCKNPGKRILGPN